MSESTDDFLEHYGVQGMKWGKRSGGKGGSGGSGKNGKFTSEDIHRARKAQDSRWRNAEKAEDSFYAATTDKGRAKAQKILDKAEKDLWNNPDAKVATKLTTGEKWFAGVTYGLAAMSVASIVATNVASNRR